MAYVLRYGVTKDMKFDVCAYEFSERISKEGEIIIDGKTGYYVMAYFRVDEALKHASKLNESIQRKL